MTVNGTRRECVVEPRVLLSDFLRDQLNLTGTHVGCEHGVCGACTVLPDGQPMRACLLFAVQVDGLDVQTVEGMTDVGSDDLHPIQMAFHEKHGLQCGFCSPGILMTLTAFLKEQPNVAMRFSH